MGAGHRRGANQQPRAVAVGTAHAAHAACSAAGAAASVAVATTAVAAAGTSTAAVAAIGDFRGRREPKFLA